MLLFKAKLQFASTCRSTWPHCASVTPYIAGDVATVTRTSLRHMLWRQPEVAFPLVQFYSAGTVWSVRAANNIQQL